MWGVINVQRLLGKWPDKPCFTWWQIRRRVVRDGKEQKATRRYSSGDDVQADNTEGQWDKWSCLGCLDISHFHIPKAGIASRTFLCRHENYECNYMACTAYHLNDPVCFCFLSKMDSGRSSTRKTHRSATLLWRDVQPEHCGRSQRWNNHHHTWR